MIERVTRLAGPTPLVRRLSSQSVLSAFGDGVFLTGSAVFFTQIVGLSAAQVGLGLTIAGVVTFGLSVPLGKLSDRFGAKRVWAICSLMEAVLYLVWLAVGGMVSFVAMMIVLELVSTTSRSARNAYRFDVFPREERVSSNAYFRAARNVGYTLGALLAGIALATNSDDVIRLVPVITAVLLLLNSLLVSRLPRPVPTSSRRRRSRRWSTRTTGSALCGTAASCSCRSAAAYSPPTRSCSTSSSRSGWSRRPTRHGCCWPGCSAPTR